VTVRTHDVPKAKSGLYRRRSEEFRAAAGAAAALRHWDVAVSNAVHSAIAGADAVTVRKLRLRSAAQGHADAIGPLRSLPADLRRRDRAVRHLAALLAVKFEAEYGDRGLGSRDWQAARAQLERFLEWVGETLGP